MTRVQHTEGPYSNGTGTKENIRYLEEAIVRFDKRMDENDKRFLAAGKSNWNIILSGIGVSVLVVGSLYGLTVAPINQDVLRLDRGLRNIIEIAGSRGIAVAEIKVDLIHVHQMHDRFRERLKKLDEDKVSAKEYQIALSGSLAQRAELQRHLDNLNKKVDEVFPPQKTLEDLTRRLAELERTRNTVIQIPKP